MHCLNKKLKKYILVWSISARFGLNLANLVGCLVLIEMRSENTLVLISGVCPIGILGEIEILGKIVFWQTSKGYRLKFLMSSNF